MNKNAESRARRLFAGVNSSLSRTDPEFVEIISNFSQDETANANILTEKERMLCILAPCLDAGHGRISEHAPRSTEYRG